MTSALGEDAWILGTVYRERAPCGCAAQLEPVHVHVLGGRHDGATQPGWETSVELCPEHAQRRGDRELAQEFAEVSARMLNEGTQAAPLLVSLLERVTSEREEESWQ